MEYVLPLGIIGLVLLAVIVPMVPEFKNSLTGLMHADSFRSSSDSELKIKPLGSNPVLSTARLTLADGTVIPLDNYPTDLANLVETVGLDGTTSVLANMIKALSERLLAEGKLTPAQANLLANLANRGFDVAENQGLLEELALKANGNNNAFGESSIQLNGVEISTLDLYRSLGGHDLAYTGPDSIEYTAEDFETLKKLMPNFTGPTGPSYDGAVKISVIRAFGEAERSGALSDPAVRTLVTSLTNRIISLSQFSASTSDDISKGTLPLDQLQSQVGSLLTEQYSTSICDAGGTEAENKYCPST